MVNLKQGIVVVNEFTVKDPKTGRGSRGNSPGKYVREYMARPLATEAVTPVRIEDTDRYVSRYMARASATEPSYTPSQVRRGMDRAQGKGGVAFSRDDPSLSHKQLLKRENEIQRYFDQGHTVLKTVISFDQEYLKERGIVDDGFEVTKKGDYRGNIDQMKLRMAVMRGLDRLGSEFDDLRAVAVIQVDTEHVHCHLAMFDAGHGNRKTRNGTQKGKLNHRQKRLIQRGIDSYLDENQHVAMLSSAVHRDQRNVTSYIKRWAHQRLLVDTTPQLLLACLPEDRRKWRASSNAREMRKANTLVRELVEETLAAPGSPMPLAMARVLEYANQRRDDEGLTKNAYEALVENGRRGIVDGCVNGVYAMLDHLPDDALQVRTPMLDAMSLDYDELRSLAHSDDADPLVDFGFKLCSYSARLKYHTEQREQFHGYARSWEDFAERTADSKVLYDLYVEEEEYHARCMSKYQHFLPMIRQPDTWYEQWRDVAAYGRALVSLETMSDDTSLSRMKDPDEAEARGLEIFGEPGAHLLTRGAGGRRLLKERAQRMRATYERKVTDLRGSLAADGLVLRLLTEEEEQRNPEAVDGALIEVGEEYDFEEVKGLDMHHMRYDSVTDTVVGEHTLQRYLERAALRRQRLDAAVEFLVASGQPEAVEHLPVADIEAMEALGDVLQQNSPPLLPSEVARLSVATEIAQRSATVRLGSEVGPWISDAVRRQADEISRQMLDGRFPVSEPLPEVGASSLLQRRLAAASAELYASRAGDGLEQPS